MPLKVNDAGHGWLMFAMPPLEAAFHDSEKNDQHELFLMCDNLAVTLQDPHLRTQTSESIEGAGLKITAYTAIRLNKQNVLRQHDAMLASKGRETIQQVVRERSSDTKFHFSAEEALLEKTTTLFCSRIERNTRISSSASINSRRSSAKARRATRLPS